MVAVLLVVSSALAESEPMSTQSRAQEIAAPPTAFSLAALSLTLGPNGPAATINRVAPTADGPVPDTIVGAASFYDDPGETASGEQYDPTAFTAAAQLNIRHKFGGIRFGRLYQPYYGLAEYAGKKLILKFNDVGPLRPGRQFDLSRAAMEYFDGIEKGVLPDVKVTVLPFGPAYAAGPVTDEQLAALRLGNGDFRLAGIDANDARKWNAEPSEAARPVADMAPAPADAALTAADKSPAPVEAAPASVGLIDPDTEAFRDCDDMSAAAQVADAVLPELKQDRLPARAMAQEEDDEPVGQQAQAASEDTDDHAAPTLVGQWSAE